MGLSLEVSIERMEMNASVQLVLHLDMDAPFPHVSSVSMLFTEKSVVQCSIAPFYVFISKIYCLLVQFIHECAIHVMHKVRDVLFFVKHSRSSANTTRKFS